MCRAATESDLAELLHAETLKLKAENDALSRTLAPDVAERLEAAAARHVWAIKAGLIYIKFRNPEALALLDQTLLKVMAGLADYDDVLSVLIDLIPPAADDDPNLTHSTDDKEQMQ